MAWFGASAAQTEAEDKRADAALGQLEVDIADITEACAPVIVWSGCGGLVKAADADAVRFGEHGGAAAATSPGGAGGAGGTSTALLTHPR
jgi:hypothetical protein